MFVRRQRASSTGGVSAMSRFGKVRRGSNRQPMDDSRATNGSGPGAFPSRRRVFAGMGATLALLVSALTGILPQLQSAGAFTGAGESNHVQLDLSACRLVAGTTLPIGGKFVCP